TRRSIFPAFHGKKAESLVFLASLRSGRRGRQAFGTKSRGMHSPSGERRKTFVLKACRPRRNHQVTAWHVIGQGRPATRWRTKKNTRRKAGCRSLVGRQGFEPWTY